MTVSCAIGTLVLRSRAREELFRIKLHHTGYISLPGDNTSTVDGPDGKILSGTQASKLVACSPPSKCVSTGLSYHPGLMVFIDWRHLLSWLGG